MFELTTARRLLPPLLPVAAAVFSLSLLFIAFLAGPWSVDEAHAQQTQSECTEDNPTVKSTSRSPAASTGYEVCFVTESALSSTDRIVMTLHEDIRVPRQMIPALVRVGYKKGDDVGNGIASSVEMDNQNDPRRPTTLTIYPVVRKAGSDASPAPIPLEATVKVTFTKAAGIANPTEGGAFSWTVHTSNDTEPERARHPDMAVRTAFGKVEGLAGQDDEIYGLLVDWEIQLTSEKVSRGDSVTAIGRGYKNGTTLTFWRDANFNGVRDDNEAQLCQANVAGDDIGYCTFSVSKPPFAGVYGDCSLNEANNAAAATANCNFINAVDGQNHTSILVFDKEVQDDNSVERAEQVLQLEGLLAAEVGPSRRLTVQMQDFPPGNLEVLELGGRPIDLDRLPTTVVPASGSLHFIVDLPAQTRRGYQSLRVVVRHQGESNNKEPHEVRITLWVEPDAIVSVFPETVAPNQRVRLEGRGFSVSDSDGPGAIAQINLGGHQIDLSRVNGGSGPASIDSNGSWFGYVDLPIATATTTPGIRELRVTDSYGRGGTVELTILPRELAVTPLWSSPGTIITVSGQGFPGRNDNGSPVSLRIYYDSAVGSTVVSAEPDAGGNFSQEIQVPRRTPAPSTNDIRVEFDDDAGGTVVTLATHDVPGPTVQLSAADGPPGTLITLTGAGFRPFANVNSAAIGNIDITPGSSVITDANGDFTLTFLVPGIGVGRHVVRVAVAGVTASSPFDISPSGVAPGAPTPVADALENLGGNLVVAFHFDDDAKTWSFYDPEVAEFSDLDYLAAGETYLILVRETVEATLNGKTRQLTCYRGNCWNQIVW